MYMYKCETEAMAIRDILESLPHAGGRKLGTLSLPLVELSKPSLQMKHQRKSLGLAKLLKTAGVCGVRKGRDPHVSPPKIGTALKLVQRTLKAAEQLGSADCSLCPRELRLERSLQPRRRTHFFGSDWYLLQMPCLPNKPTSFSNLQVPLSFDRAEIKLFFYIHHLNLGRIQGPDNMGFPYSLFLLLTIFPLTLIWPVLLSLSNLTCLSLCNENTDSRFMMWYIVSSSHNTLGSLGYGIKEYTRQVARFIHEKSLHSLTEK